MERIPPRFLEQERANAGTRSAFCREVPCPSCKAPVGTNCQTVTERTQPHTSRAKLRWQVAQLTLTAVMRAR